MAHEVAGAAVALDDVLAARARGQSVVLRAEAAYDGLDLVLQQLSAVSPGPVHVTDLLGATATQVGESVAAGTPRSAQALLAYHTSGSTGSPKCVVYQDGRVESHAAAVAAALGLDSGHRYVALTPAHFAYGSSIWLSHAACGIPVRFCLPTWGLPGVQDDDADAPLALYLLPQQVPLLLNTQLDPGRVERVFIAGGRISGPSVEALAARFPHLRLTNMYGQAEMGPRLSVWDGDPSDFVEGSIGKPISGVQLRLADEERGRTEPVPLLASSEHAMWTCLKPPYQEFEDGPAPGEFIDTGDLAMRTPDGGLTHQGRGDHVLNVAGTKIDGRGVTRLIEERFRPLIVRVTAKPSRVAGDVLPVLEVVPGPGGAITTRDVRQTLHADYGNLASLFDVRIVDRLNLGESGK
ncbi:MAG: acyl--CoA ligase [Austwickia sp.]|nr:acyl--CoA ligase [Austwickia sp.]